MHQLAVFGDGGILVEASIAYFSDVTANTPLFSSTE